MNKDKLPACKKITTHVTTTWKSGHATLNYEKWSAEFPFTVSTAHCIMSFAAKNGVGIQQRSIRDVIGYEKRFKFLPKTLRRISNTDKTRQQLYFF